MQCLCQTFSLRDIVFPPLYLQVSQAYQTMNIDNLSRIIPFLDFSIVEKISVDAVKHNYLTMKMNYMKGSIIFGNNVSSTSYYSFFLYQLIFASDGAQNYF